MQIEIKDIYKSYGKREVLRGVSLSLHDGQCVGILGANGSGKSTLLSILAGVLRADSGSFLADGEDMLLSKKLHQRNVGYVPQGTPLLEELTARDNMRLWYSAGQIKEELVSGVPAILGVGPFLDTTVSKMSGGMKKRLSIACAVASHPRLILLDEPTAALDVACKQNITEYLKKHKAAGGMLILATHDPLELALCDKCYIIKNGVAEPYVFDGDIEKLAKSI